jgi:hypothetical protein
MGEEKLPKPMKLGEAVAKVRGSVSCGLSWNNFGLSLLLQCLSSHYYPCFVVPWGECIILNHIIYCLRAIVLIGESPNIPSFIVCFYGSGQP